VGIHPAQPKQAIIELDPRENRARQHHTDSASARRAEVSDRVIDRKPEEWDDSCATQYAAAGLHDVKGRVIYTRALGN
jgi:hypothetical protein